jgi:hypothetical protein
LRHMSANPREYGPVMAGAPVLVRVRLRLAPETRLVSLTLPQRFGEQLTFLGLEFFPTGFSISIVRGERFELRIKIYKLRALLKFMSFLCRE